MKSISTLFISTFLILSTISNTLACGIYLPREGDANIIQERALIRWVGGKEEIVLEMSVQGEATEAAWILPVPSPAEAELGKRALFDELQELTKPSERTEIVYGEGAFAGAGAPGRGVTVLEQKQLGPFEVSSLAAADGDALDSWLAENGYSFPAGIDAVLDYYVEKGWYYVAIKLRPNQGALSGALDPIHLRFDSDEIVYPMRAAGMGSGELLVVLYVLAEHRVQSADPQPELEERLRFAGWVEPQELATDSSLASFIDQKLFLTKYETLIRDVSSIKSDFVFEKSVTDELFRDEIVRYDYREETAIQLFGRTCTGGYLPIALVIGAVVIHVKSSRKRVHGS